MSNERYYERTRIKIKWRAEIKKKYLVDFFNRLTEPL